MNGKLIVIEGLDGSGKATQTALLCDYMKRRGVGFRKLSFPDYDSPSSSLVKMYLNGEFSENPDGVNAYAASSFYAVDRCAGFMKDWKKDYDEGMLFIADRYATSNAIYQTSKLPFSEWDEFLFWLEDLEYRKLGVPKPDAVIYLDMPIEISQKLMSLRYGGDESKKDIHESNIGFLKQCRETALYAADKLGWTVVSCGGEFGARDIDEISRDIIRLTENII